MQTSLATTRILKVAVTGLCGLAFVVGSVRLVSSVPWGNYVAQFWDCSTLIQGVQNPGFPTGENSEVGQYAVMKYGYALPVWLLYRVFKTDAIPLWGTLWFLVLLVAPVFTSVFRRDHQFGWTGFLAYAALLVAMPFTHKYLYMANPTIQSTALWMLLALFYETGPPDGWLRRLLVVPGLLCGLLVLTDYKWFSFCVVAVLAIESVTVISASKHKDRWALPRAAIHVLDRVLLALLWIAIFIAIASLTNQVYLRSVLGYAAGTKAADAFRLTLSGNFFIFLWILGGFWFLAWLLTDFFFEKAEKRPLSRPDSAIAVRLLLIAIVIILGFSVVFWPRSARMYAPVVALLFCLGGRQVQSSVARATHATIWPILSQSVLIIVLIGVQARAFTSGASFKMPTGVDQVAKFLTLHRQQMGTAPVGCYAPPIFEVAAGDEMRWTNLAASPPADMDWVVTSEFFDRLYIGEFDLRRGHAQGWAEAVNKTRLRLLEKSVLAQSFANDFYRSPAYLCEVAIADRMLLEQWRRGRLEPAPRWELRFVGGRYGRAIPDGLLAPE